MTNAIGDSQKRQAFQHERAYALALAGISDRKTDLRYGLVTGEVGADGDDYGRCSRQLSDNESELMAGITIVAKRADQFIFGDGERKKTLQARLLR